MLLKRFVNTPLKKLQSGLSNFFLFLQNKTTDIKPIEINSNDEFGQMAKMLNENIKVSAKLHEQIHELNTNLEKKVKERTVKISTLLNNAGQGFLVFDKNFIIDGEYSKECEKYLGSDIANKNIADILFYDKEIAKSFKENFLDMKSIKNKVAQKSVLSLLPSEIILNKRALKLEYKLLENDKTMLILTNISAQKRLEKKIKKEQDILKMIVSIVENSDAFYDIKKEYEEFAKNKTFFINQNKTPLNNLNELYRAIHTFKGAFLQIFMNDSAKELHNIESTLSKFLKNSINVSNEELIKFLQDAKFESFIENDLNSIKNLLGAKFLENDNFVSIDKKIIKNIEEQYIKLLQKTKIDNDLSKSLLDDIKYLSQRSLKSYLKPYVKSTMQIAKRLEKEIYEFEIIGNDNILVSERFKPFLKSLIHVFRNSVDHGIEFPEIRAEIGKDEVGTISCSFKKENEFLQIVISDDGAGIDAKKIRQKLSKQIDTTSLDDEELYGYIFKDNFSTKDEVGEISGRGVGMSAIKIELEKIRGRVMMQSKLNIGTTFIFELPLQRSNDVECGNC